MNAACPCRVSDHHTILSNFNHSHQTMGKNWGWLIIHKSQNRKTLKDEVATYHVKKQAQHFFHANGWKLTGMSITDLQHITKTNFTYATDKDSVAVAAIIVAFPQISWTQLCRNMCEIRNTVLKITEKWEKWSMWKLVNWSLSRPWDQDIHFPGVKT
jgi:hypothetical protein